mgnify:CR=1 FL=1
MSTSVAVLTGATLAVGTGGLKFPLSVALKSTDAGRAIQISVDGLEYISPTMDSTTADSLILAILSPVTKIKVTGAANDTLTLAY